MATEKPTLKLGIHLNIQKPLTKIIDEALTIGCTTFQIFTRNPRGWKPTELNPEEAQQFKTRLEKTQLPPVSAHMPYLPNLAAVGEFYEKSVESLTTELTRCSQLGITYIVTHLGSHQGQGYTSGLNQITKAINKALIDAQPGAMLLLENTAGTTHSMGSSFEELKRILDGVNDPKRVGICLDTCHAYAAGYDLGNIAAVNSVFSRFDGVIDLDQLRVIHLNDSKEGFRSKVDRHARIGEGYIGEAGIRALLSHPKVRTTPLILETPAETREQELKEIEQVRRLAAEIP